MRSCNSVRFVTPCMANLALCCQLIESSNLNTFAMSQVCECSKCDCLYLSEHYIRYVMFVRILYKKPKTISVALM